MQISQMNDDQLRLAIKSSALREQESSIDFMKHLLEVHQRNLWVEDGFSSLWEYIRSLGYSEYQAYEREGALKLMLRNSEAEKAIETGKITLNQAAMTERVLKKEEKETKTKADPEVVQNLIDQVHGKSKRETEKVLLAYHPENVPKERLKQVTETLSQANFSIDEETRRDLEKYWNLKGKTSLREVFSRCLHIVVEQEEKKIMKTRTCPGKWEKPEQEEDVNSAGLAQSSPENPRSSREHPPSSTNIPPRSLEIASNSTGTRSSSTEMPSLPWKNSAHRKRTRYIPQPVRRQAREAAQNQCEYTDERTGRRCESRHLLQFDHIYPFTFGGTSDAQNIRVLCSVPLLSGS